MAVAWANGALSSVVPATTVTATTVTDVGTCCPPLASGRNARAAAWIVYGTANFAWNFAVPLAVFVACYSRVFKVILARSKVKPGSRTRTRTGSEEVLGGGVVDPVELRRWRRQTVVVKTMTIVTALFAVLWFPNHVYFLLASLHFRFAMSRDVWYASVFLAFLNICLHPFVYATKLDVVRDSLKKSYFRRKLRASKVLPVAIASVSINMDMQ